MSLSNIFGRKKKNSAVKTEHQLMIEPDHDLIKQSKNSLTIINRQKEVITNKASP
ncbi:hypothetical protein HN670_03570 [bacterium]|nr:hypothetical protein [bacterium]